MAIGEIGEVSDLRSLFTRAPFLYLGVLKWSKKTGGNNRDRESLTSPISLTTWSRRRQQTAARNLTPNRRSGR